MQDLRSLSQRQVSNPNFVSKAPEKKINEEKAKQAKYQQMMDDAIEEAQEHGVTVYRDIDKSKFIEAVQPMHEAFESKGDAYKSLYEDIQKYAVAEEEEK